MDEAEKYQQRLQAIAEKRRMQEEAEKVRRGIEEECLKLAQHKRKTLREQWLMDRPPVTSSSPEDPKLQSIIPAFHTTEQSAEEAQRLGRQMKKEEVEKSENINEESSQIREDEPTILAADSKEKLTQAYLEEEERNVLEVLDVKVKRNPVSEAAQEDTEEQNKATIEKQEVGQSAMDAVKFVDLSQHSLQQVKTPDEANLSLDDEEWEIVNCSSEEAMDLVLTSDLTQDQSDSCLENKRDGAVLEVEQIFIMDEEEDLQIGASEVLSLVVAKRKSDLEDTSCEKPHEGALQTLCLEKGAHLGTSAPLQELDNVPGTVSEEPSVFSVDRRQNLQSLPAHATAHVRKEILGDNTKNEDDRIISASTNVKVEWKEASGLEDEVRHHIPLEKKREQPPSLLQRKIVAQSTESEIQILSLPSGTLNRAETVISNKRKTCYCCIVM